MPSIFISYRRDDSWDATWRIHEYLQRYYPHGSIFIDVDNIPPGVDFRGYIQRSLQGCGAMLLVIGDQWANAVDKQGRRRLDQPNDFVRVELEWALENSVPIIPLLIRGTPMPGPDQLPQHLEEVAYINAAMVRSAREFADDMERLLRALEQIGVAPAPAGGEEATEEIEPGKCRKCGRHNQINRRVCGRCREALWEACVDCGFENGTWDDYCGQCGERPVEALQRRFDALNLVQERVAALRNDYRHPEAIAELDEMSVLAHPRLKSYADWATESLMAVRQEQEEGQRLRGRLVGEARAALDAREFPQAVERLVRIPERLRQPEDEEFLAQLRDKIERIDSVCARVDEAVAERNLARAWKRAAPLFEIEPDPGHARRRLSGALDLTARAARANFNSHKYDLAARAVDLVPGPLRDESLIELRAEAVRLAGETAALADQIRAARQSGDSARLFDLLPQFLRLHPEHREGRALLDARIHSAADAARKAWNEGRNLDSVVELVNVIPPALRSEEIQRRVSGLRRRDAEFRDGKLGELLEQTLSRSQVMADERKFQQAMQLIAELPETPPELGEIKYLLMLQVRGAQDLDERYRRVVRLANDGERAQALELLDSLPDDAQRARLLHEIAAAHIPDLVGQERFDDAAALTRRLSPDVALGMLVRIEDAERAAGLQQRFDAAFKTCIPLLQDGKFDQARAVLSALPDATTAYREAKENLLRQINEHEQAARLHRQVQTAIDESAKLVHAFRFEDARRLIRALPDSPEVKEVRQDVLRQIDEFEKEIRRIRAENEPLLARARRTFGAARIDELIAQAAKDNKVTPDHPHLVNQLLKAMKEQGML